MRRAKSLLTKLHYRDYSMVAVGIIATALVVWTADAINKHEETALEANNAKITSPWIPETVKFWHKDIAEMSKKYNLDANLIAIIMTLESGGDPKAESEVKAKGLMQIMPLTAQDTADRYTKKPFKKYDLLDGKTSIEFGTAYLAMLRDEYGTDKHSPDWNITVELIASAYNGGFSAANAIEKGEGIRDTQTLAYSRDAFNMWRERNAGSSPTFDRWKERGGNDLLNKALKYQSEN